MSSGSNSLQIPVHYKTIIANSVWLLHIIIFSLTFLILTSLNILCLSSSNILSPLLLVSEDRYHFSVYSETL